MSVFMKYEDMWDLPIAGPSKEKKVTHWVGNIVYAVLGFLCKVLFRYRVDHRENIRAFDGVSGVLVVANHTSFLDVVFMWLATRPRQWIRFMARDTLFPNAGGLLGQIISRVGAFPVKRDSADRTSLKRAARMLKDGECVGILPEGTRRGKGSKQPEIHSGAAFVAKMGKAPILPMTVRNAEKVKQKGKFVRFPKVSVDYGNPILLSDFDFVDKGDRLEAATWYALRESFALFYNKKPEEVDMVALFPDGHDFTQLFNDHPLPVHSADEVAAGLREAAEKKALAAGEGA